MKAKKVKGAEAFGAHFFEIYGDRWPTLREAMLKDRSDTTLEGTRADYHLDSASLHPPSVLKPEPGESILDLCSAPGGKALQLALAMDGLGSLVLNELSATRRQRLKRVIEEHLEEKQCRIIKTLGQDGSLLYRHHPASFDGILIDAPCSSERHLLHSQKDLETWGPKRSAHLSHRQMGLLCSALEMLKPGGRMVYSTCSISPQENEILIRRFLKKRKGRVVATELDDTIGEGLEFGRITLPDAAPGQGPMFTCRLERVDGGVLP